MSSESENGDEGVNIAIRGDVNDKPEWETLEDVDWRALWQEFGFDTPGPVLTGWGASITQAAAALSSSERTSKGWDVMACKGRIEQAIDRGYLVEVKESVVVPMEVHR